MGNDQPADCTSVWHSQREEPTDPCPECGDTAFPFAAAEAAPGTILILGNLVVRRRQHATIGLPWKSKLGTRYDHHEVDALYSGGGAQITFCSACAAAQLCEVHDQAHMTSRPYTPDSDRMSDREHDARMDEEMNG